MRRIFIFPTLAPFNWDMSGEEELMDSDVGSVTDLASDSLDI